MSQPVQSYYLDKYFLDGWRICTEYCKNQNETWKCTPSPIPRQNLGPIDPLGGPFTSSLVQEGLGIGGKGVWYSLELVIKYNELN